MKTPSKQFAAQRANTRASIRLGKVSGTPPARRTHDVRGANPTSCASSHYRTSCPGNPALQGLNLGLLTGAADAV